MFKRFHFATILKFLCPLFVAMLPCMIAMGFLSPWPVAQTALGPSAMRGALLVGWSYKFQSAGLVRHERREQLYAVLPTLKTINVIQEDGDVRTEEEPNGLLRVLALYACLLFGVWWFWFRRTPSETTK